MATARASVRILHFVTITLGPSAPWVRSGPCSARGMRHARVLVPAMAGEAVHARLVLRDGLDLRDVLLVDGARHGHHVARDLLVVLLVAVEVLGDVALRAAHAQRPR